ncbi:MAG TPA: hypothetical protein PK677_14550 [Acidiphilium sp.]|nr:hypothetical protein [Acidiphilium sp.]
MSKEIIEWVCDVSSELESDAVGLWQIIPYARRDFGSEKEELNRCIRKHILTLLERGAKPVRGKREGKYGYWVEQKQYGTKNNEIVEAIISEWEGWGCGDPNHGGLWFALPNFIRAPALVES